MQAERSQIAAFERSRPGRAATRALKVRERLRGKARHSSPRFGWFDPGPNQHPRGSIPQRQKPSASHGCGGMVESLLPRANRHGNAAEFSRHSCCLPARHPITFDSEDNTFQRDTPAPAEGLQRMHRAHPRSAPRERLKHLGCESPARVQRNLSAQRFSSEACQFAGHFRDRAVRGGDEEDLGIEHGRSEPIRWPTPAEELSRATRVARHPRHNRADRIPGSPQTPSQALPDSSGTEDGDTGLSRHFDHSLADKKSLRSGPLC